MYTVNLAGETEHEIIDIITWAGRTAKEWYEAKKDLGLKIPYPRFEIQMIQNKYFKQNSGSWIFKELFLKVVNLSKRNSKTIAKRS